MQERDKRLRNIVGIVLVLIVLVGVGYALYRQNQPKEDLVEYRDPGLTNDEKTTFDSRITEIETKLEDKNLSKEDKFRYYMDLGANYVVLGQYKEARQAFAEASGLMPDNIVPYKELLILSGKMGDMEASEQYFNKLIEVDPVNRELYQQIYSEIKG